MTRPAARRKPAKKGSEMSWRGYDDPACRICPICKRRVLLREGFRAHSQGGVRTVVHTDCERAGRAGR